MYKIYTEQETANILRIETSTLENLRRRKKINGFFQGRERFYLEPEIVAYQKRLLKCEENPNLSNYATNRGESNLHIGTSNITAQIQLGEKEANAALRAVKSARKIAQQTSTLQHSR